MRIFYCIDIEDCKNVSEIVEAWLFFEKDKKETQFCFKDYLGLIYSSEKVKYGIALMWLRTLAKNGYVEIDNNIFTLEEDD